MKKILVVGSMNMDLVTRVSHIPCPGETILGQEFEQIPGGKGANQALAISKLGGHVGMIGRVGKDSYGEILIKNLKTYGVDIEGIEMLEDQPTGTAFIMVADDGNNSIVVVPGANSGVTGSLISDVELTAFDMILCQMEIPIDTVTEIIIRSKNLGLKTILNPAPGSPISSQLLNYLDLIIPNENEFQIITGQNPFDTDSLDTGMTYFFEHGVEEVIVTLGDKGAIYRHRDGKEIVRKAYKVKAVDTTAAGDSFIGGVLSRLVLDASIEEAIQYGMMVGAVTVSRKGAQSSLPDEEEISAFKKSICN